MGLLNRDSILTADDIKYETLPVPEWNGEVRLRGATAAEMDAYEAALVTTKGEGEDAKVIGNFDNAKARLAVKCIVDENGMRVFKDEDAENLGKKSAGAIDRIFQRVQTLSGKGKKAQAQTAKNSETGPS